MSEKRFSYNPFTKDFIEGGESHAVAIYNKGKQKQFDEYIRGIVHNKILYLRTYYPFTDFPSDSVELNRKSAELLESYEGEILKLLSDDIRAIFYNAENDLLAGKGLANV